MGQFTTKGHLSLNLLISATLGDTSSCWCQEGVWDQGRKLFLSSLPDFLFVLRFAQLWFWPVSNSMV